LPKVSKFEIKATGGSTSKLEQHMRRHHTALVASKRKWDDASDPALPPADEVAAAPVGATAAVASAAAEAAASAAAAAKAAGVADRGGSSLVLGPCHPVPAIPPLPAGAHTGALYLPPFPHHVPDAAGDPLDGFGDLTDPRPVREDGPRPASPSSPLFSWGAHIEAPYLMDEIIGPTRPTIEI
jgi:hypothetical protein